MKTKLALVLVLVLLIVSLSLLSAPKKGFIDNTINQANAIVSNGDYFKHLRKDEKHRRGWPGRDNPLSQKKHIVAEMQKLQKQIDLDLRNFTYSEKFGIKIYGGETLARLNLLLQLYLRRWGHIYFDAHNVPYLARFLQYKEKLNYTPPVNQAKKELVLAALEKAQLPRKLTNGITFYLMPYSFKTLNGWAHHHKKTRKIFLLLFGKDPYPTKPSASLVMHEMGHAVHKKILGPFGKGSWPTYWRLRKVKAKRSKTYDNEREVFAEDFRVLFGNSPHSTFKRKNKGKYGDIRDYSGKRKSVQAFIKQKIQDYQEKEYPLDFVNLPYPRIFKPDDSLFIKVNSDSKDQFTYAVYSKSIIRKNSSFQKLPPGENKISLAPKANDIFVLEIKRNGRYFATRRFLVIP